MMTINNDEDFYLEAFSNPGMWGEKVSKNSPMLGYFREKQISCIGYRLWYMASSAKGWL